MTAIQAPLLFLAAVLAGALNSVAGGGSFISFPSLVWAGLQPTIANATNTVALWPGSVASAGAYRKELATQKSTLLALGATSLTGGILGAVLLLHTPQRTFLLLLPYLLLAATLLFAFGPAITRNLRGRLEGHRHAGWAYTVGGVLFQLFIAVYGGYFGGGIGMLMLALLSVIGMEDIHAMNALKTVLGSCINGVAVVTFIVAHAVVWPHAALMVAGAIVGGYGGARYARTIDPALVRRFVIGVGVAMSVYFFVRAYVWGT